jgi:hypothetical protein
MLSGFWYFMIPVLSFGWLSAVPFVHAGLRLRDRRVLCFAGLYAVGGITAFILLEESADARGQVDWKGPVGLWSGVILAAIACRQLSGLRRRVYPTVSGDRGVIHDVPTDKSDLGMSARSGRRQVWSLMQLERQLRPEAYGRRRGGYVDRRRTPAAER